MKMFGNIQMQDTYVEKLAITTESAFPANPTVGRILFMNKIVYICVEIVSGLPVWVPLTKEVDTATMTVATEDAATLWEFTHNLNTNSPLIQIYDTATNRAIFPDHIQVVDSNRVNLAFTEAQSGTAVAMFGSLIGSPHPQYAFEFNQTTGSTTWVVPHNLGHYPIVRVFIGNQEVQPLSIVHDSLNQTTITFSLPQIGYATFI